MRHLGIPQKIINIIQSFDEDTSLTSCGVIHNDYLSEPFTVNTGVRSLWGQRASGEAASYIGSISSRFFGKMSPRSSPRKLSGRKKTGPENTAEIEPTSYSERSDRETKNKRLSFLVARGLAILRPLARCYQTRGPQREPAPGLPLTFSLVIDWVMKTTMEQLRGIQCTLI